MKRILGIDYGQKRVGLALSDPLGLFASGLKTLPNTGLRKLIQELKAVIAEYQVELLVIGLPVRSTGQPGTEADNVQAFGTQLAQATGLQVIYEDERFTSVIAQQALRAQGVQPSRQKHLVDQTSAALILQQYLDKASRGAEI